MTRYTANVTLLVGLFVGLGLGGLLGYLGTRLGHQPLKVQTSKNAASRLRQMLKWSERRYLELEATAQQQRAQWAILEKVRGALSQELEPKRVLKGAADVIANETPYRGVSVSLVENEVLIARYSTGELETENLVQQPLLFDPRVQPGEQAAEPITRTKTIKATHTTVTELTVPLFDGLRMIGTLSVQGYHLTQSDRTLLNVLSKEVSVALERSRLLSEVRQSETNLQDFLDNASDLIQSVSPDGHFFYVNQTWKDRLGYSDADLAQLTLFDLIHPGSLAHCAELFERVLRGEEVGSVEAVFLAKDGRRVRVRGNVNCRFEEGEPVATRSIFRDVTDVAEAEASLRHYQHELEEKNRRLEVQQRDLARLAEFRRALVAFVNDTLRGGTIGGAVGETFYQQLLECAVHAIPGAQAGSLLLEQPDQNADAQADTQQNHPQRPSEHGNTRYAYAAAVGYDLTELQRVTFVERELIFQHEGDAPQLITDYSSDNDLGRERRDILERAGRTRDIAVSLNVPVQIGGKRVAYLNLDNFEDVAAFGDEAIGLAEAFTSQVGVLMTRLNLEVELHAKQRDIEHANVELAQANRLKSEFLANMSHELRTPLTAIIGFSELLKEELFGPLNDKQTDYVRDILEAGHHLLALINDILDLSKIEAGQMELAPAEVDVAELLEGVLSVIRERAQKAELSLHAALPNALPLYADPRKLKQVLYNLLSNAVKFTPLGGEVRLRVEERPDAVHFFVTDTGIGISEADVGGLFREFSQVDSSLSRRHDGTGLGLALSKRLIELHGGSIWVESEIGKGSTFGFWVPKAQGQGASLESEASSKPGRRALVIEDDERTANLLCAYLESGGFGVLRAANGLEGLELVREHRPDVVTLDIMMPVMSGWSFLEALRADPDLAATPVVVVSVVSDAAEGAALGAAARLKKPVEREAFLGALRQVVAQASAGAREASSIASEAGLKPDDAHVESADITDQLHYLDCLSPLQAQRAREVLERLAAAHPDLMILDLELSELRQDNAPRTLPVMVMRTQPTEPEAQPESDLAVQSELSRALNRELERMDALRDAMRK